MALFKKFVRSTEPSGENQYVNDILENLNCVLNSKKGYGAFLRDFGVRDMNEYFSREHIARVVIDEVKQCIEQYEPRLELVNISVADDTSPLRLSFKIECRVRKNARSFRMIMDSSQNRVSVDAPWG